MASAGRRCLVPCVLLILLNALIGELRAVVVVLFAFLCIIAGFKCTAAHDGLNLFPVSGRTSIARMENQMEPVQCPAESAAQSELTTTKFRRALFI